MGKALIFIRVFYNLVFTTLIFCVIIISEGEIRNPSIKRKGEDENE
jgi:hypothetical protein